MQKKDTEQILLYYGKIEKQLDSVNMELAELQDRYSPIKGLAMDGMPHGSTPGGIVNPQKHVAANKSAGGIL